MRPMNTAAKVMPLVASNRVSTNWLLCRIRKVLGSPGASPRTMRIRPVAVSTALGKSSVRSTARQIVASPFVGVLPPHAEKGHEDLVVLRHPKRRPPRFQNARHHVALGTHEHVLTHGVFPRFKNPFGDGGANQHHGCAILDLCRGEVSTLCNAKATDREVQLIHALNTHVGVGPFAASRDARHACAID